MAGGETSYGLESIVLHHSFDRVKGRTIRVPCRERTHLGGVNGAGKTSVLALVPAFFGEEPERIVTKASGKASFLDYYLPTFQSLIIFEYRRSTGICCAVMFRHNQGKACYRFVTGSAAETFFAPDVRELLKSGSTADDVFGALRRKGVAVSKIIDTITNYRAIIQRNQKLLKRLPADARWLRSMAADFGLGSADTQMSSIDRLTHVVLNKNRLLTSFKTMICETQFENIHQYERPRAVDRKDLIADIRSLTAFSAEEGKIRDCLRKDAERKGILEQTDRTVSDLTVTLEFAREKKAESIGHRDRVETQRKARWEEFEEADREFALDINEKQVQYDQASSQLNELHDQNERYEAGGLPEKVREHSNLGDYRHRLETAIEDHDQLVGKASEVETEFEADIARIEREFERQQATRQGKLEQAKNNHSRASHDHEQKERAIELELANSLSQYKDARSSERVSLSNDEARLKALRDTPSETDDERDELQEADSAIAQAEERAASVEERLKAIRKKRDQAESEWAVSRDQLDAADKMVGELDARFNDMQRQIAPEDGTWLSLLRRHDPDWGLSLAKVIDPKLLHRKDIAPAFIGDGAAGGARAVMGWRLNVEDVPVPDFAASEGDLKERSRALDGERTNAFKRRADAEKEVAVRHDSYKQLTDALDSLETDLSVAQHATGNAKNKRDNARARIRESLQRRTEDYRRQHEATEAKLSDFDAETQEGVKAIEIQHHQRLLDIRANWSDREADLIAETEKCEELIRSAKSDHAERLRQKQEVYDQRLSEEGIDPGVVRKSRESVEKLKAKVEAIVSSEDLVREYLSWRKREWEGVDALSEKVSSAEATLRDLKKKRGELESRYKFEDGQLKSKANEFREAAKKLAVQIEAAEGILKHFANATVTDGFPGDIADLTQELQGAHQKLDKLRKEVVSTFDRAAAILNQYHDTQIHKAWQKLSAHRRDRMPIDVMEHEEAFKLARVPDLRELLDTDIPQLRDALVDQFMSESGSLVKYYEGLDVMAKEVKSVSSLLRRKINTDQQIESLSDIRVVLHPRIYEDETWQPLKEFVESWQDWSQLHKRELPSEAILRRFQFVTDTLSDARVKDSIESLVDLHIEMKENDRQVVIRNDADFLSASSTGLTYLAIMAVFMGLTRYLCPDFNTRITWPIDELGTLSDNNISRLSDMLEHHNLTMISACPKLDRALRRFFENKISLKNGRIHTYESAHSAGGQSALISKLTGANKLKAEDESNA